jgi:RNA polymerase sigma-70 factor (ECF subfamily)
VITGPSSALPKYLSALFRGGIPAALSDGALLDRFASRQSAHDEPAELAFAALLARHGPMVLRVCRGVLADRHEVEDAFQATFLVLAVRAGSIRRRHSVASWLYGVALRVSAAERSRAARRRRHELRKAMMTALSTADARRDPVLENDLSSVIHDEIGRLPEKYRAVVVLCYLEGLTHEMAAEQLGLPVGSVRSRLAWARDRLRRRLTRRGIAPEDVPFGRSGSEKAPDDAALPCIVPTTLVDATIRGALRAGVGKGALTGIVSAEAITLLEGTVKAMTNARHLVAAAAVIFAGLLTAGLGAMGYSATRPRDPAPPGAQPIPAPQKPATAERSPSPQDGATVKDPGPVILEVQVVDSQGRGVEGVDVFVTIASARPAEGKERDSDRGVSDRDGRVRMEVARERVEGRRTVATLWAYQPGRALTTGASITFSTGSSTTAARIVLAEPVKRTIKVVGLGEKPIAGLRLFPRVVDPPRPNSRRSIPEELRERLTVSTDENGVATLPYLAPDIVPVTIEVGGVGIARQSLALIDYATKPMLRLKQTGRLVGVVRAESGEPLADIPVAVWVKAPRKLPARMLEVSPPESIRFDSTGLATGPQGTFQTPAVLLVDSEYRISIGKDGFAPFVSEWITLGGERTTIPPIRLRSLRVISGRMRDSQGSPVRDARVFLPAAGPAAITDQLGRFVLRDVLPDKTFILAQNTGFRTQGWPVDPASQSGELQLTLVRTNEPAAGTMKVLDEPITLDEARALAVRVLEPNLKEEGQEKSALSSLVSIQALGTFDPDRALELFRLRLDERSSVRASDLLRVELAEKQSRSDPVKAQALVEQITDKALRAQALISLAKDLPASKNDRKRELLESAARLIQGLPANPARIRPITALAGAWLDLGEVDKARPILHDALKAFDTLPSFAPGTAGLLRQLMRVEPELALSRIAKVETADRFLLFGDIAPTVTFDQPDEAERFFRLAGIREFGIVGRMRMCRRLANVDPPRARKVAAGFLLPGERVCAWAYVALGLAGKDPTAAREALDRALQEIDRLRELGTSVDPGIIMGGVRQMYPTNPAAVVLPVVERVALDRLPEFFWRAVALHPRIDAVRDDLLWTSFIGDECMVLARYDREVAAVMFAQMDSYLDSLRTRTSDRGEFTSSAINGKACIDPRAAVALLEALDSLEPGMSASYTTRNELAEVLGQPREDRWKSRFKLFLRVQHPPEE